MKQILYILSVIFLMASCKSVEKMVEKGQYDEAIVFAAKKLHGEKNKKTKYVRALEEAFAKVTQKDVDEVKFLMAQKRPEYWDRIYTIYTKMETRQNRIEPFLPLISKDGYHAKFQFLSLSNLKATAADKASDYHYNYALELLKRGEVGDKDDARNAYREFRAIDRYYSRYKEKDELAKKARYLGKTRVSVEMVNNSQAIIPFRLEEAILDLDLYGLDENWTEFYNGAVDHVPLDVKAIIDIEHLYVSPGTREVNHFHEKKRIQDGVKYVKDKNGNFLTDSTGVKITKPKYIKVSADVREVFLEKFAEISGKIRYYDLRTDEQTASKSINSTAVFKEYGCTYTGDRRALSKETKRKLNILNSEFLPSDADLAMEAAHELKNVVRSKLRYDIR